MFAAIAMDYLLTALFGVGCVLSFVAGVVFDASIVRRIREGRLPFPTARDRASVTSREPQEPEEFPTPYEHYTL